MMNTIQTFKHMQSLMLFPQKENNFIFIPLIQSFDF